jgi:hypothetical protein
MDEIWEDFWVWIFEEEIQRRGVHVNVPEIGSRAREFCFGGIQRFYAELRRELFRRNLNWGFLKVLLVGSRGVIEEGGHYVFTMCFWGNLSVNRSWFCEPLMCYGMTYNPVTHVILT